MAATSSFSDILASQMATPTPTEVWLSQTPALTDSIKKFMPYGYVIRDGNIEKMEKWLESLEPEQRKQVPNAELPNATLGRPWYAARSKAWQGGNKLKVTVLQHAVQYKQQDIARAILHAAGIELLDSSFEQWMKRDNLTALEGWLTSLGGVSCDVYKNWDGGTALHLAAKFNKPVILQKLLDFGGDPNAKRLSDGATVFHVACMLPLEEDCNELVQLLILKRLISAKDNELNSALHYAACSGNTNTAKLLLDNRLELDKKNRRESTPLFVACLNNRCAMVEFLIDRGAKFEYHVPAYVRWTPLTHACAEGHEDVVQLLLDHGAKSTTRDLSIAFSSGYKSVCRKLLATDLLKKMRNTLDFGMYLTPFREAIRIIPDVAEEVLNKCVISDPTKKEDDEDYNVLFSYEFIEDFRDPDTFTSSKGPIVLKVHPDFRSKSEESESVEDTSDDTDGIDYDEVVIRDTSNYSTTWGPQEYKKRSHPLAVMVEHKRLDLLQHPVVMSLLHYKWRRFGQFFYITNLLSYCVFLSLLTAFALIEPNPNGVICSIEHNDLNDTNDTIGLNDTISDCPGLSTSCQASIYFTAIGVLIIAFLRLFLELYQLVTQHWRYVLDWINWLEWCLFICSIIFVWVFSSDCLCVSDRRWQVGVVAIFLGWIGLINFISKLPYIGIYVLMFFEILKTVLKLIAFAFLLVLGFGLVFYMTFFEPGITHSPFSTVPRSFLKVMTMTTGEFDFDAIFRQDPSGAGDGAEEIPFPPVAVILWIVFVILMPIILTNMLTGLAIGDVDAIKKDAELKKLALQVDHVLTIEDLLPMKFRRKFITAYTKVDINSIDPFPYNVLLGCLTACLWCFTWPWICRDIKRKTYRTKQWRNLVANPISIEMWGGKRYDKIENVQRILKPLGDTNGDKTGMLKDIEELKESQREMKAENHLEFQDLKETYTKERENLLTEIEELNKNQKEIKCKNDKLLLEVDDLKATLQQIMEILSTTRQS